VDELIDSLHATEPADPAQPVLVAGDPQRRIAAEREKAGIPIPPGLRQSIAKLAEETGATFLLD